MADLQGWSRGTWGEGEFGEFIPVSVTGEQSNTAIGTVAITADAVVQPTGVSSGVVLGTALGEAESIYPLTGVQSNTATGTLEAQEGHGVIVTGVEMAFADGTEEIIATVDAGWGRNTWGSFAWGENITIFANLVGQQLSTDIGTPTIVTGTGETAEPTTVLATTATGTVSLSTDQVISVNGLQTNIALQNLIISGDGSITVTAAEDQMDMLLGQVTAEQESIFPVTGVSMETGLPGILGEFTTEGSTALSTDEAKFGVSSVEFDGTSGQGVQQNIASGFGSGDFTSEFWIYSSSIRSQSCTLWDFRISGLGLLLTNFNGQISFFKDGSGGSSPTSILTNDTWHHIAIVRTGSTGNVYVDGNLQITRTIGTDDYSSHTVLLGNNVFDTSGYLSGYIDEYRNSNIVRYSSNFTPPTSAFTPDANTTALLHFDGADGSIEIVNSAVGEPIVIESAYSLTGSQSNTSVGTTTIESAYTFTGEEITTNTGTLAMTGSALVEPTGVTMQFADGTATAIANAVVEVTGVTMQFADGTATAVGSAIVTPIGVEMSVVLGNMRSTPWANVVTGASNTWIEVAA
jgi:hypothetical protein